jgi:hypothetical protein
MKLTIWKWVFWWGLLGLLVPAVLLLRWKLFDSGFGQFEATLWPSSIMTMVLEGSVKMWDILVVYTIALVANIILYSVVGLLTWPVVRFVLRRRAQAQQ